MSTSDPVEKVLADAGALLSGGDKRGALKTLEAGLANDPNNTGILLRKGQIYCEIHDYYNAVGALQLADKLAPKNSDILLPYSKALFETGKIEDALKLVETTLHLAPDSNPALENAYDLFAKAGKVHDAIICLQRLNSQSPEEKKYLRELSRLYEQVQQYGKAYQAFQKVWDVNAASLSDFANAGALAFNAQRPDDAIAFLEKSVTLDPKNARSWTYLGRCHAALGDKKAAEEAFQKAVATNPGHTNAYFFLSGIKKFSLDDPGFAILEDRKARTLKEGPKSAIGLALGWMYHSAGDHDKAFENFSIANSNAGKQCASIGFTSNRAAHDQTLKLMPSLYSRENRKKIKFKGRVSNQPVFILGLPRSGTTLLEQIMAAHSDISSAGELINLTATANEIMAKAGKLESGDQVAKVQEIFEEKGEAMAASYLQTLEEKGDGTPLIIDKMPQNFMQIGLINVLFPNAKIIHIKRDPLDVGLSIFCNPFSCDWVFFHDLEGIGFYIRKYREVMAAWKTTIDLPIYDVDYQALVENPEDVARGVIEFCGLEWQPECLEFYKNPSQVFTSSVMQVRRPVNKSGLGKWKAYEKHLGPLKAALDK